MAVNPFAAVQHVCSQSRRHVRLNPPAMDSIWDAEYEEQLLSAVQRSLEQGADASAVYQLVAKTADRDVSYFPSDVLAALISGGGFMHCFPWRLSGLQIG